MNPQLIALASTQGDVFSVQQARQFGISGDELKRACRQGSIHALRRGVFAAAASFADVDIRGRHRLDIAAAVLLRQKGRTGTNCDERRLAAGGLSAGLMWDLPCPPPPPRSGTATTRGSGVALAQEPRVVELVNHGRGARSYRFGVSESPANLPMDHVAMLDGVPLTSAARSAADLMRVLDWEQAVFVADAALRKGVSRAELETLVRFVAMWPGGRQAVRAYEFADGSAESVAESLARIVIAELGLPAPELQAEIWAGGAFLGRVDFLFRAQQVIVEIDGRVKYTDPKGSPGEVLWREKQREDRLREAGWEVVRITWAQLTSARAAVGSRIRAAFTRAHKRAV